MKIVICGAGQVGSGIAEKLASEDNDVTLIDTSSELVQAMSSSHDVHGITGHGSHPDVLEAAGAADADMIIAATFADEVNMMACEVAHAIFGVPIKIARVRSQSYLAPAYKKMFSSSNTAIDFIISPEIAVGEMVLRRLALPGAFETIYFAGNKAVALGIRLDEDCPVINTPLSQLTELFPDLGAVVVAIRRGENLFVPHSSDQMMAGDHVFVIAGSESASRVLTLFGHEEKPASHVLIAGGGNIGLYVAEKIEQLGTGTKIRIIENNEARAEYISERLRRAVVLNGSALDDEILREAGSGQTEAFVALTNDDKVNILSGMTAKLHGAGQVMTLVTGHDIGSLAMQLGLDTVIDPRSVTISSILKHVRRGRIRGVHPVLGGAGEIVEAEALETARVVGHKLREVELPEGVRVGVLVRGDEVLIPTGDTEIRPGDKVVMFALKDSAHELQNLFRVSMEYF